MARKTIKVEIPRSKPDAFITLLKAIVAKHDADPATSKLDAAEVSSLKTILTNGEDLRLKSVQAKKLSESLMEESNMALGLGKNQTKDTANTALYLVTGIRDGLLKTFRNNEEKLSEYGFKVVVGTAKSPSKKA